MSPDFRGKGKAKYLLATALDEFQKNKQRAIYVRIKVHNLPSLKAFERVGFKHCLKNQEFVSKSHFWEIQPVPIKQS